jgi:hypothetical protein
VPSDGAVWSLGFHPDTIGYQRWSSLFLTQREQARLWPHPTFLGAVEAASETSSCLCAKGSMAHRCVNDSSKYIERNVCLADAEMIPRHAVTHSASSPSRQVNVLVPIRIAHLDATQRPATHALRGVS